MVKGAKDGAHFVEIGAWKGDLILFPSFLLHYVPTNTFNANRGGLAMNLMLLYNLGEEEHVTYFDYEMGVRQY